MTDTYECFNCGASVDDPIIVNREKADKDYPGYEGDVACNDCCYRYPEWVTLGTRLFR
jgi:hypothetical protein